MSEFKGKLTFVRPGCTVMTTKIETFSQCTVVLVSYINPNAGNCSTSGIMAPIKSCVLRFARS